MSETDQLAEIKAEINAFNYQRQCPEITCENISRIINKKPAPPTPWTNAPEWAQWRAMDLSGIWLWYQQKPIRGEIENIWSYTADLGDYKYDHITPNPPPHPDWRNSLEKRP
jgi:hypothetical protein